MAETAKDLLIACHIRVLHCRLIIQPTADPNSRRDLILYNDLSPKLEKEFKSYFNLKSIDYIDSEYNMIHINQEYIKPGFDIGSDQDFDFGWSGQFKYPALPKKYDFIIPVRCPIFLLVKFYMEPTEIKYDDLKEPEKALFFYLNHLKIGGKLIIYSQDRYSPENGIINDKLKMKNVNISYFKGQHRGFPRAPSLNLSEVKSFLNANGINFYLEIPDFETQSVIIFERTSDAPITYNNDSTDNYPGQSGGKYHINKLSKLTKFNYNKNKNHNNNNNHYHYQHHNQNKKYTKKILNLAGGGGNAPMDLQGLTPEDVQALMQQGIMPEQIAQLAQEQGQPIPPIILEMLSQSPGGMDAMAPPGMPPGAMDMGMGMPPQAPQAPPPPSKTSKFPAMMDLPTYAQYKNVEKAEQKQKLKFGAHKPTVFGYVFSDLISEDILRDMKRTQGGFLIGVNLNNLFNTFREAIKMDEKGQSVGKMRNPEEIFKRVGEYVNVDFDKILETKMGYRGSDMPMLPEQELNEYSSFGEVINESKKYVDSAFKGIITPLGLLIMTRMLYKYRKNNAQWVRVATVLELIHRYLGGAKSRLEFFKEREEIPIQSLIELEEFYNTDHIFMTENEIHKFKRDLDFYKYDPKINIRKQIQELLSKAPPII